MKLNIKIFFVLLLACGTSYGQETIEIFLNSRFEITNKENASCKCQAEYDLDNFRLGGAIKCSFLDGAPRMTATYQAGSKNGFAALYGGNGQLIFSGHYKDNLRDGTWRYYYPDGKLMQVIKFTDEPESREMDANIMIGEFYDRQGRQLVKNGNGIWANDSIYKSWGDNKTLKSVKGLVKDSLKHGIWELGRLSQRKSLQVEEFENGRFVSGTVFVERDGSTGKMLREMTQKLPDRFKKLFQNLETVRLDSTVFADSVRYYDTERLIETITGTKYVIRTRSAGYKYGDLELMEYIATNIKYPKEALRAGHAGIVFVQLTIGKDGKSKDVKVLKGAYPSLDAEAVRVIKTINDWVAGLHNGQPYEKTITIPVRFRL
jgi:TonB family protein